MKAEAACRDCGRKGHCSGEAQCNHQKKRVGDVVKDESESKQKAIYPYRLKEAYENGRRMCKDPDCECEEKDEESESEEKEKGGDFWAEGIDPFAPVSLLLEGEPGKIMFSYLETLP